MSQSLINLSCYEPAGESISLSEEDITGHTLAIGGSGSGKTTRIIYPVIEQLIASAGKPAIVIIDSKADGEMGSFVRNACSRNGRLHDLVNIDGSGGDCLDLLLPLKQQGLSGVDSVADLLGVLVPGDERNLYWETTYMALLKQILRIFLLSNKSCAFSDFVTLYMQYLLSFGGNYRECANLIVNLELNASKQEGDHCEAAIYAEILSTHKMWETLDVRTRSNLQSMSAPVLSVLNSPTSHSYLTGCTPCDVHRAVTDGRIILLSVDAIRHGGVARLVGCILKAQYYDAVLSRRDCQKEQHRLATLILDDWPLLATGGTGTRYSDVDALALIRSRGAGIVAACHGLSYLDCVLGYKFRKAALANFANLLLFRSRDWEVDQLASWCFGERKETAFDKSYTVDNPRASQNPHIHIEREVLRPRLPNGALARLPTGEAYALISGRTYDRPLCLVPSYPTPKPEIDEHR